MGGVGWWWWFTQLVVGVDPGWEPGSVNGIVPLLLGGDLGPGRGPLPLMGAEKNLPQYGSGNPLVQERGFRGHSGLGSQASALVAGMSIMQKMETRPLIPRDTLAAATSSEPLVRDLSEERSWG